MKLKGRRQPLTIYDVFDADPPELREAKRKTKLLFEEALARYHLKEVATAGTLLAKCLPVAPNDTVTKVYRARCDRFLETGFHESSGEVDLIVRWDPSLTIGHAKINALHRGLFEHVQSFVETLRTNRDWARVHALIEYHDEHAARHFETEGRFMAGQCYPFLQLQRNEHRCFADYLKGFRDEIAGDPGGRRTFLLFSVQVFLIDWLINHISKLDGHFGRYLRHAEAKGTTISEPQGNRENHPGL